MKPCFLGRVWSLPAGGENKIFCLSFLLCEYLSFCFIKFIPLDQWSLSHLIFSPTLSCWRKSEGGRVVTVAQWAWAVQAQSTIRWNQNNSWWKNYGKIDGLENQRNWLWVSGCWLTHSCGYALCLISAVCAVLALDSISKDFPEWEAVYSVCTWQCGWH